MRFGMVTQWFDPETGSAALPAVIARALQRRGHEMHVLTGYPNYPSGGLYPGYSVRPYRRETRDGIIVHRGPLYPSHDSHPVRRIANYLSFAAGASAVGLARLPRLDAVLVHSTPATAAIPALVLKAVRGTPYVLHIQDLWPETVVSSGFLSRRQASGARAALQAYCDAAYRHASAIAVTSPSMVGAINARHVPSERLSFVPNWADESAFHPSLADRELGLRLGINRPFVAMYAGNFGEFQILDSVLAAASRLISRRDIQFVLVGGGVQEPSLRERAKTLGLDNVTFVPPQSFQQMAAILALGDVQLITLQDLPLFRGTLPSKLQATMSAGRPILGALTGDAAAVLRDSGAGHVVAPGDDADLAASIELLASLGPSAREEMGQRGRDYYLQKFSEPTNAAALEQLLVSASTKGRR